MRAQFMVSILISILKPGNQIENTKSRKQKTEKSLLCLTRSVWFFYHFVRFFKRNGVRFSYTILRRKKKEIKPLETGYFLIRTLQATPNLSSPTQYSSLVSKPVKHGLSQYQWSSSNVTYSINITHHSKSQKLLKNTVPQLRIVYVVIKTQVRYKTYSLRGN